jgi:hypothetical protein
LSFPPRAWIFSERQCRSQYHGLTMLRDEIGFWTSDWFWGLLLLTGSVVLHTIGLQAIEFGFERALSSKLNRHGHLHANVLLATIVSGVALLHSIEAGIWAFAYVALGALPVLVDAIRFSLGAMTTSGADGINLLEKWKLLGGRLSSARREGRRHTKSTHD